MPNDTFTPIFQSRGITITQTLAMFSKTTYPIAGIGSILIVSPQGEGLLLCISGLLVLVGAVQAYLSRANLNDSAGIFILFCFIALLVAALAMGRSHTLVLRTASGDQNALKSKDLSHLQQIKVAIEEAVSLRG